MEQSVQKAVDDFQQSSKDNYDAVVRSYSALNKNFQAIAKRWADFSKRSFEDANHAWERVIAAKSLEQAMEIQAEYAKSAYDNWMAEMTKFGEMYSSAARDAYKPVEKAIEKTKS